MREEREIKRQQQQQQQQELQLLQQQVRWKRRSVCACFPCLECFFYSGETPTK